MKLPIEISKVIDGLETHEIQDYHVSGDCVYNVSNKYILKVSTNIERLEKEYKKDEWFSNVLPTPKPICFIVDKDCAYYLRSYLDGEILCLDKYLKDPQLLMKLLKEALDLFHSKSVVGCPYVVGDGNTLIHGDFCLPNILVKDNKVVGFIDIGEAGIGDIWCDYAWCIWSLEFNLKTDKYTKDFLDLLEIEFNLEKFEIFTKD